VQWPPPTYYIAPGGSDENDGKSPDAPWQSFEHAISQLRPGDTLGLLDGTYTIKLNGMVHVDAGRMGNAVQGRSNAPITLRAINERQAILKTDGLVPALFAKRTRYWNFLGLTAVGTDKKTNQKNPLHYDSPGMESVYALIDIDMCANISLKRCLAIHSNRLGFDGNNHVYLISRSHDVIVEECEVYKHHRHGMINWRSENGTFRRCYINPRGHWKDDSDLHLDIAGIRMFGGRRWSSEAISFYRSSWGIIENCINEGNNIGFNSHGGDTFAVNIGGSWNHFLGNISLNNYHASRIDARREPFTEAKPVIGNVVRDFVAIGFYGKGLWFSSASDSIVENVTIYNGGIGFQSSPRGQNPSCEEIAPFGGCSFILTNGLIFSNSNAGIVSKNQNEWLVNYCNSWNNQGGNYEPSSEIINDGEGHIRHSMSIEPTGLGLGEAQVIIWIPEYTNMKRAGFNGADIGANILYRYVNGQLTNIPLWNPYSGEFPHGAIVEGINSIEGDSLFDVHTRLNVNNNGTCLPYSTVCALPDLILKIYYILLEHLVEHLALLPIS